LYDFLFDLNNEDKEYLRKYAMYVNEDILNNETLIVEDVLMINKVIEIVFLNILTFSLPIIFKPKGHERMKKSDIKYYIDKTPELSKLFK
jgi:hypothetical protein